MQTSKIKSIKHVKCENTPVFDIGVPQYQNFILDNGLVVHNCKPYQYFKNTIYERRIEVYDDSVLKAEVIDLERNLDTGKVDHPDGGAKDKADAVCGAIFNASKHAEEFAYDYGESSEELLRANDDSQKFDQAQIAANMEESLKTIYRVLAPSKNYLPNSNEDNYTPYDEIIIL